MSVAIQVQSEAGVSKRPTRPSLLNQQSFVSSFNIVDANAQSHFHPALPKALHRIIYEYHTERGSGWFRAWDAFTGDGSLAIELSRYFQSVYSTSQSASHADAAQAALLDSHHAKNAQKVSFYVQEPTSTLPGQSPSSVDTMAVANAIHTVAKPQKVITAAADMLKGGGTMATWVVGYRFFFVGSEEAAEAQKIWDVVMEKWIAARTKVTPAAAKEADVLDTRLDSIAYPEFAWEGVKRIHWNRSEPMVLAADHGLECAVGNGDEVESYNDRTFMALNADLDWMVNYLQNLDEKVDIEKICADDFSALSKVLGGRGKKYTIGWPVTLVLATRK